MNKYPLVFKQHIYTSFNIMCNADDEFYVSDAQDVVFLMDELIARLYVVYRLEGNESANAGGRNG